MNDLTRTALTTGTLVALTPSMGLLAAAVSSRDPHLADPLVRTWAKTVLRSAGVRPVVEGLEHLPASGQAIYVCNHQSHFDVVLVVASLERHIRFVGKAELFRIPLFGFVITRLGTIKVDRRGDGHDKQVMAEAIERVRTQTSILFFAEGTRSEDGALRPFKRGAATLALQAQVPVVPIAVAGTKDILPKGSKLVHGGKTAALVVGAPIPTAGRSLDEREAVTLQAYAAVERALARAEALVRAHG